VDFSDVDKLAEYRQQARAWVERHVDPDWAEQQRVSGSYHTPELHALLAGQGWLGAGWPAEYGGTDNDPDLAAALFEEIDAAGLHMDGWITTTMICRTILHTGTEEQKRTIVGGALAGEVIIVLGYTEPDSGSDVAAAKTKAERDGDEWLINGQKMFTSTAHMASHVFMLTRSNTEVAKHKGLTTFLVPLDGPGVEIRAIHTLGGQRTNATFYSDVREKHVAVKGLGVGDMLEFQWHWHTTKPLAPGQFWFAYNFSHDGIILQEQLQIGIPRNRPVKWKSSSLKPVLTEDSAGRFFTWTSSHLEAKSTEEEKQDQEQTQYQAARGKLPAPEIQLSSFQSWEEVGGWYTSLQRERVKPTAEIRTKAAELTKGSADDAARRSSTARRLRTRRARLPPRDDRSRSRCPRGHR